MDMYSFFWSQLLYIHDIINSLFPLEGNELLTHKIIISHAMAIGESEESQ